MIHLIGQPAEDLLMVGLADALSDHVPQVPQHGHEWKRLIVCMTEILFINVHDYIMIIKYYMILRISRI